MDNFVITPEGVGFVDFGSAVRTDEDLRQNPLLASIFDELMKTSQIQRMLEQMTRSGHVTSETLCRGKGKVDKAVDVFYLALQVKRPQSNPDLYGLVEYDPGQSRRTGTGQVQRKCAQARRPVQSPYSNRQGHVARTGTGRTAHGSSAAGGGEAATNHLASDFAFRFTFRL